MRLKSGLLMIFSVFLVKCGKIADIEKVDEKAENSQTERKFIRKTNI
jgi:hypothetical protein